MSDASRFAPSRDEVRVSLARLREQIPGAKDNQAWQKMLSLYALKERDIETGLRSEAQMMNFIEVRLRPSVHVQPEEVEAYYRAQVLPDMEKVGVKVVTFEELEPRIREVLVEQHIDQLLDTWLHNLRQQTPIHSSIPLPARSSAAAREAECGI